jgi:hypothetical protein
MQVGIKEKPALNIVDKDSLVHLRKIQRCHNHRLGDGIAIGATNNTVAEETQQQKELLDGNCLSLGQN